MTVADLTSDAVHTVHASRDAAVRPLTAAESTGVRCIAASALEPPLADAAFYVVVMAYLLHHVSAPSRRVSRTNVQGPDRAARRRHRLGPRVQQPMSPSLSPPGRLWEWRLRNRVLVAEPAR